MNHPLSPWASTTRDYCCGIVSELQVLFMLVEGSLIDHGSNEIREVTCISHLHFRRFFYNDSFDFIPTYFAADRHEKPQNTFVLGIRKNLEG